MKIRSFRDLQIWQEGIQWAVIICQLTEQFPISKTFGLPNQTRRAAVSVSPNIAKSFIHSEKRYRRYLQILLASLAELETRGKITKQTKVLLPQVLISKETKNLTCLQPLEQTNYQLINY